MLKKIFRITALLVLILWISGYAAFTIDVTGAKKHSEQETDAIIVLTGGNNRVKTGLELFAAGLSDNLFITGVNKTVTKSDITSMWNGEKPLPDCCITLGYKATTTLENALEAKEWVEAKDIKTGRLVTSSYHMSRAMLEFRDKLNNVKITPHAIEEIRSLKDIQFWKITFSEYNKTLFRYIFITLERQ